MNFGQWGEEQACKYLKGQGYRILDRNFHCRTGELDIVAERNGTLCFVEVKSRKSMAFGLPAEAVTPQKQRRMRSAASFYMHSRQLKHIHRLRMDVVEVLRMDEKTYIRHIQDAF